MTLDKEGVTSIIYSANVAAEFQFLRTSMSIKYTEKGNTVVEVGVRDMRVLHGPTPTLHAHCHVADLLTVKNEMNKRSSLKFRRMCL